jgi:AcrR family transcriptional regulator
MEEVLDAALRLLDRGGIDELSMRRLADEVGLGVMTLYGYVRTKEELLGELGAHALAHVVLPDDSDQPWDEQLVRALGELHEAFSRHPGIVDLLIAQVVTGPALNHVRNGLLGILVRAGFDIDTAVEAFGSLVLYVFGFAVAERTRQSIETTDLAEARYGPLDDFPYLKLAAERYPDRISPSTFGFGLRQLVEGLRRQLR